jgi:hypothetical protein
VSIGEYEMDHEYGIEESKASSWFLMSKLNWIVKQTDPQPHFPSSLGLQLIPRGNLLGDLLSMKAESTSALMMLGALLRKKEGPVRC